MTPKPIIRWPGGKTRLLSRLLPLVRPHDLYVEAFAGGLALFLAKPPSAAEVINDLNGDLINLYRYAQFHLDPLIDEIRWTLNSREELAGLVAQPGLTGLQRAARFLLKNRMSFGGGGTSFAVSKRAQPSRTNVLSHIRALNERLDKVSVENLPYDRLLDLYDSPRTLWFFDPPYTVGKVGNYGMWGDNEMRGFAARVNRLAGDWIVTVNDNAFNRALFAGHEIQAVCSASGGVNRKLNPDATFKEILVRRRAQSAVLRQSVPMKLTRLAA